MESKTTRETRAIPILETPALTHRFGKQVAADNLNI